MKFKKEKERDANLGEERKNGAEFNCIEDAD